MVLRNEGGTRLHVCEETTSEGNAVGVATMAVRRCPRFISLLFSFSPLLLLLIFLSELVPGDTRERETFVEFDVEASRSRSSRNQSAMYRE